MSELKKVDWTNWRESVRVKEGLGTSQATIGRSHSRADGFAIFVNGSTRAELDDWGRIIGLPGIGPVVENVPEPVKKLVALIEYQDGSRKSYTAETNDQLNHYAGRLIASTVVALTPGVFEKLDS